MIKFLLIAVILWLYFTLWFLISLIKHRNDVADIAWGMGFILVAWAAYLTGQPTGLLPILILLLITAWGVRLTLHIASRNLKKKEDHRYEQFAQNWGKWAAVRSYFQVFFLQGCLLFVISLPFCFAFLSDKPLPATLNILFFAGLFLWIVGFFFESVGDWQLRVFLSNPEHKGKIMQSGLWRYTRHPNYFGEVTVWWGVFLICLAQGVGVWTIIGPLTISYLIGFVSGVPLLEKKYAGRTDFEKYKQETNIFFPWWPKKNSSAHSRV